jgi:hypothetical protein
MPDNDGKPTPLTDVLPAKARKWLYWAYALAGVVDGALLIAGVNVGATPQILAYLAIPIGATAGSNVRPTPPAI